MPIITSRTYADQEDLQPMIDLILKVREPEWVSDYPGIVNLREMLALASIKANTRLWFRDSQMIAFALVDDFSNLVFEIEPEAVNSALEAEIITWGEECIRRRTRDAGEGLTLDASCREEDVERLAFLERHGFITQPIRSLHLKRSLNDPIPEPILPDGFEIRPSTGSEEVQEWVLLHRAAHGTTYMTIEERLAMISGPEYDPLIDLVAVAPDGRLAAYCFGQIRREENLRTGRNEGHTDPVATHPDFQRRGLARALLLRGMRLLKERGMESAVMGTSSENKAMQHVALAAGYQVESTTVWFSKSV